MVSKKNLILLAQRIINLPVTKKTYSAVSFTSAAVDVKNSMTIAMNPALPPRTRAIAVVRGSCCSGAIITSYFAAATTHPDLKRYFETCCHGFATVYSFMGGNAAITINLAHNATMNSHIK